MAHFFIRVQCRPPAQTKFHSGGWELIAGAHTRNSIYLDSGGHINVASGRGHNHCSLLSK